MPVSKAFVTGFLIIIVVAFAIMISSIGSANAGDRYYHRNQNDRTAQAIIGLGLMIGGAAIIAGAERRERGDWYYHREPLPRYHQPRVRYYQPRNEGSFYRQPRVWIPSGCFYPRPNVYYNMRQDNDSAGRTVVCP